MRPSIALCHDRLAGLYRLVGQSDRAGEHLGQADVMFSEMEMPRPFSDERGGGA